MNMRQVLIACTVPLMALTACAYQRPEDVTAQMARTEAVLQQAEGSGAKENALPELQQAKDKYADAKLALRKDSESGDREAMRLAKEAEADAKYASAKAQASRQQDAAREVQQGVQALSEEAQRNAASPPPVTSN